MAWVINTKGFVFAIIGMGYALKLFILCLLLFNLTLAPYGLTHTATIFTVA
jgi:formate hydrogenlyase subunit 4